MAKATLLQKKTYIRLIVLQGWSPWSPWWGAWQQAGMAGVALDHWLRVNIWPTNTRQRKEIPGNFSDSEASQPTPADISAAIRPCLLILLQQFHQLRTKCSNIGAHWGHSHSNLHTQVWWCAEAFWEEGSYTFIHKQFRHVFVCFMVSIKL